VWHAVNEAEARRVRVRSMHVACGQRNSSTQGVCGVRVCMDCVREARRVRVGSIRLACGQRNSSTQAACGVRVCVARAGLWGRSMQCACEKDAGCVWWACECHGGLRKGSIQGAYGGSSPSLACCPSLRGLQRGQGGC